MSLTKIDLDKIGQLISQNNHVLLEYMDKFATKKEMYEFKDEFNEIKGDFNQFKDILYGIRKELDTEHKIRQLRIEENTTRINRLENVVGVE